MASSATASSKLPPPSYHEAMGVEKDSRELPGASIREGDDALFEVREIPAKVTAWKISFIAIPPGRQASILRSEPVDRTAKPFLTCYYPLDQMSTPYSHSFNVKAAWEKHKSDNRSKVFSDLVSIEQSYSTLAGSEALYSHGSKLLLTAMTPGNKSAPTHMHFDVCLESMQARQVLSLRYTPIMRSRGFPRVVPFRVSLLESLSSKSAEINIEGEKEKKSLIVPLNKPETIESHIETTSKILDLTITVLGTDWEPFKRKISLYSLPKESIPTITLKRDKDGTRLKIKYKSGEK